MRFEREAKVLAALNHPNIAIRHGMEVADGRHFLVMELVAGQTLAEVLAAGPMTAAAAVDVARRIAEAREAAHEQGIVHRDLKPANVKITPDEKVKVLDFGLAKAFFRGQTMMAVSVEPAGSSLKAGIPVKLFDTKRTSYIPYDVLRDGTFVVNTVIPTTKPAAPTTLRVLMNWQTLMTQ